MENSGMIVQPDFLDCDSWATIINSFEFGSEVIMKSKVKNQKWKSENTRFVTWNLEVLKTLCSTRAKIENSEESSIRERCTHCTEKLTKEKAIVVPVATIRSSLTLVIILFLSNCQQIN